MPSRVSFFCENCGKKVHPRDKICPHCGRFFSQVRCPSCNTVGTSETFLNGCPKCGYLGYASEYSPERSGLYETAYVEPAGSPKEKRRKRGLSTSFVLGLVAAVGFILTAVIFFLTVGR